MIKANQASLSPSVTYYPPFVSFSSLFRQKRVACGNVPMLQLRGSGASSDIEDESEMGSTSAVTSLPYQLVDLAKHEHNSCPHFKLCLPKLVICCCLKENPPRIYYYFFISERSRNPRQILSRCLASLRCSKAWDI